MTSSERERFAQPTDALSTQARIRELNDKLRTSLSGGKIMLTEGLEQLGPQALATILFRMRNFSAFEKDNDPYGEHDFGSVRHGGDTIFWKIDYYAPDFMSGSEDPSDPAVTQRVLTIMLASEY